MTGRGKIQQPTLFSWREEEGGRMGGRVKKKGDVENELTERRTKYKYGLYGRSVRKGRRGGGEGCTTHACLCVGGGRPFLLRRARATTKKYKRCACFLVTRSCLRVSSAPERLLEKTQVRGKDGGSGSRGSCQRAKDPGRRRAASRPRAPCASFLGRGVVVLVVGGGCVRGERKAASSSLLCVRADS